MTLPDFFLLLLENLKNSSFIEIVAVTFGILSVWYAKRASILVYPTGIVSVIIYVYICFDAKLYADMGINGVYFIMSIYGWVLWSRNNNKSGPRPVTNSSIGLHLINILLFALSFAGLSYLLKNHTDSNVPVWDSLTTALFISGMLLMALKKTENWIFWIIGDVISIPLYYTKGLALTSMQYTIFLILAVSGYIEWIKILRKEQIGHQNSNHRT